MIFVIARYAVDSGNRVVFDKDGNGRCISYLECTATGIKMAIHERNGTYQFDMRAPQGRGWGTVEEVRGQEVTWNEGFPRHGTLMADLLY